MTAAVALAIAVHVFADAERLDALVQRRRLLLERYDSLRITVESLCDVGASRRARLEPELRRAIVSLQQQWRAIRPIPGTLPRLNSGRGGLLLVLADDDHSELANR